MNKQNKILIYPFVIIGVFLMFTNSCNNDDDITPQIVADIDGNVYTTVTIGTQIWMVENLKVTRYRNGDLISNVTITTLWPNSTTGAYCWYNNDINNKATYGALYNWYAVSDSRNIAPTGWHVATDSEWTQLIDYLGGENVAGGKLKEIGFNHWYNPNTAATNESGFTALPGGLRGIYGGFGYDGYWGYWWSTSEDKTTPHYNWVLNYDSSIANRFTYSKIYGLSVRCVKD
jgi:uncharacterized protein (TIGR02145 family)